MVETPHPKATPKYLHSACLFIYISVTAHGTGCEYLDGWAHLEFGANVLQGLRLEQETGSGLFHHPTTACGCGGKQQQGHPHQGDKQRIDGNIWRFMAGF